MVLFVLNKKRLITRAISLFMECSSSGCSLGNSQGLYFTHPFTSFCLWLRAQSSLTIVPTTFLQNKQRPLLNGSLTKNQQDHWNPNNFMFELKLVWFSTTRIVFETCLIFTAFCLRRMFEYVKNRVVFEKETTRLDGGWRKTRVEFQNNVVSCSETLPTMVLQKSKAIDT